MPRYDTHYFNQFSGFCPEFFNSFFFKIYFSLCRYYCDYCDTYLTHDSVRIFLVNNMIDCFLFEFCVMFDVCDLY